MKSFQQKPAEIVSFPHGVNALVRENGGTTPRNRMVILMQSRKPVFVINMRWQFCGMGVGADNRNGNLLFYSEQNGFNNIPHPQ